jgi:NADH-quinone oxidoreductase subunit E
MNHHETSISTAEPDKLKTGVIQMLENIQAKHGYLPKEELYRVARETNKPLVDIYGVATFYRAFSLVPRGRHLISVCLGTACHVRGGPTVAKEVEKILGIKAGQTTEDREFTLETVNCLGACALGPVIVIDGHYYPKVQIARVSDIIDSVRAGEKEREVETDQRLFPLEVSCSRCNHSLMDSRRTIDGYPAIRVTIAYGSQHGPMALSSVYGSYKVESEYPIPEDMVVNFFCPYCHAEMIGGAKCGECGAPMVPMIVRGGGIVQICSRKGCKGHMLDLGGAVID